MDCQQHAVKFRLKTSYKVTNWVTESNGIFHWRQYCTQPHSLWYCQQKFQRIAWEIVLTLICQLYFQTMSPDVVSYIQLLWEKSHSQHQLMLIHHTAFVPLKNDGWYQKVSQEILFHQVPRCNQMWQLMHAMFFFLVSTSVSTRRKKRLVLPEFLAFKHDCNKYLCSQINGKVLFGLELFSQVCP